VGDNLLRKLSSELTCTLHFLRVQRFFYRQPKVVSLLLSIKLLPLWVKLSVFNKDEYSYKKIPRGTFETNFYPDGTVPKCPYFSIRIAVRRIKKETRCWAGSEMK
jgi:hypothetical protein